MNMGKSVIDFNEKKGFICDMDGVIYHGNQILPGVPEFIQWLHDEKKEYLFILNYICLFNYLFISSQMSAKPYFIGSTGILLLW